MAELVSQPTSIQSVYSLYRDNKLFVNRRYQRKLVWTLEEKQKLIESILKKYPIPAILIAEKDDQPGSYEIIDGLQRLHAMLSFIETSFSTTDGKYFSIELFPTAKSRADEGHFVPSESPMKLSQRDVTSLLDYSLALSVMRNATESEINDVFDRINTYGHRLSDQERRQAGVQNDFSAMVREIACTLRGDVSLDIVPLKDMPSISIDLPKSKHGYEIRADEVFWVRQGILRSTDLRDSMDEQCVADIAACIVGGQLIERSKLALDRIFNQEDTESERILSAINVYGSPKFSDEFKFCVSELLKICAAGNDRKLRDIVFKKPTSNAFPSVFAIIVIALHELFIKEGKIVSDYEGAKQSLVGLSSRVGIGQKATSADERRKNVSTTKGLLATHFINASVNDISKMIYGSHTTIDIESDIRRSEIETGSYELKQGVLTISKNGKLDESLLERIIKTIAAIANNGPKSNGKLLIGIADKEADADRVKEIDKIEPVKIGKRYVVGVEREAKRLGISIDKYVTIIKESIRKSTLSSHTRDSVLSSLDFNSFYGLGVVVINIPSQSELSYVGDDLYWRNGDSTELVASTKQIAAIAKRF